jgi:pimeloyl-ACP methyl ester carboxylesterase
MFLPLVFAIALDSTVVNVITAPRESLHVTIVGEGQAVVIVPGFAGSAFAFRKVTPTLANAGLRIVVIEPLGVGASSRPDKADYSLTAQSDRIAAVMDSLHLPDALVVAHSVAASIALRLAVRHPDRVTQLLLIDGGPDEQQGSEAMKKAVEFGFFVKIFAGRGKIRSETRKRLVASSGDTTWITPEVIDGYTAGPAGDMGAMLKVMKGWVKAVEPDSIIPHLDEIKVPVRLMLGTAPHEAGIGVRKVRYMRESIPNFAIDSVPGAGLHIHEEQPEAVIHEVLKMLGRAREEAGS